MSAEDGIAKLGLLCNAIGTQVPCFYTFRGYDCRNCSSTPSACVDPKYTAKGIEPFVIPRPR